ncbi:MAG TPA: M48 family peptidase [Gammaproteobacteria bacterium]|nr:M48 family peptidase [Gammaproteobacteria bacterium]
MGISIKTNLIIVLFLSLLTTHLNAVGEEILLPNIGADNSSRFSEAEEKLLGETFMRQVRLSLPVSNEPEVEAYLSQLGFRLIANTEFQTRHFSFFLIKDPNINAFAGPNGYIGINAGLILNSDNESELASVMAHEIAHVTQRHLERSMKSSEKLSLPTAAAIIAAIVLSSSSNINLTEAAIFATVAANYQTQLKFSRAHEREADHIGMRILARSGFNPQGMPSFFEKLLQGNRLAESQMPEFLSTHPVTINRIAESRNRASQYHYTPKPDSLTYFLTKAKLQVMMSRDKAQLIKHLHAELKEGNYQNEIAHRYAYALALLEAEHFEAARNEINKIIQMDRKRIPFSIVRANIEIKSNNLSKGYRLFAEALSLNPGNPALSLNYADALMLNNNASKAIKVLKGIKNYQPGPIYYQLLAKAEEVYGNAGASHRLLAEYYLMYDQIGIAIDHLQQALNKPDTSQFDAQNIKNRIVEIKTNARLAEKL